jgi:hypothetical protein
MGAAVDADAEVESDGGSDDDGDQFNAACEEGDHAVKRAAFEAHARSLDGKTQNVTVGASNVWCPTRVKRLRPALQNHFDSSRPNLFAQVAATNKTYTWAFRDPKVARVARTRPSTSSAR